MNRRIDIYKHHCVYTYEDTYFSRLCDVVHCPNENEKSACYYTICVDYGVGCTSKIVRRLTDVVDTTPIVSTIHKDVFANILQVNNRNRKIPKWETEKIRSVIDSFENPS